MHHTGIKTDIVLLNNNYDSVFQLHHTGIKTRLVRGIQLIPDAFQLHHTGIKTPRGGGGAMDNEVFQLHHTGIKTEYPELVTLAELDFNCTIQELKQQLKDLQKGAAIDISIAPYRN
ncbi:hypothetical protein HMPREF1553_01440 [Porphyromonas gingivalis F0568]|nr:hypothetical protein HMPREF1553_01440 [Porphyromonas gingivalis F0568]